jgi:hypothetical protein
MIPDAATLLVYVLLIITGISLFLFILTLLFLRDLSGRIREMGGVSSGRGKGAGKRSRLPLHDRKKGLSREKENDLTSGIERIAGKYQLDSLIVASRDGLVVAFTGSSNPEFEAAYYTDMHTRNKVAPENGLRLFELGYGDMPLVGIARGRVLPTGESERRLAAEIVTVLREQLGQPA